MQNQLVASLLAAVLLTAPARGQATSGIVPAPISVRDLDRYASLLGMNAAQRLALEVPHDAYLAEFALLRDTEIEAYVRESGKTRYGFYGFLGMTAEQIETGLDERRRIMRRIGDLDDQLLGAVRELLTETQHAELPRVEQGRERVRYGSGMQGLIGRLDPAGRIDLAVMLADLDPEPDTRRAVDPVLRRYELELTAARRRFDQRTDAAMRAIARGMDERGIDPGTLDQYRAELARQSRTLIADLAAIAKLNRRTVRDLRPVLDDATWRSLHEKFHDRGYEGVGASDNPGVSFIEAVLGEADLPAGTRSDLVDLLTGLLAECDRLTAEGVDALARMRAAPPDFLTGRDDAAVRAGARLAEIATRRATANENAIRAATAMLDPAVAFGIEHVPVAPEPGEDGGVIAMFPEREHDQIDPFLPGPISDRDVTRYAAWLGLSETKCAIVFAMHDDYREAFDVIVAGPIRRVLEARVRGRSHASGDAAAAADAARTYRLRRAALEAILAADALFFEDVSLVLTEEETEIMPRLRRDRQRRIFGPRLVAQGVHGMQMSLSEAHEEARIDLGPLLDDVDPADVRDRSALHAIRGGYEDAVAAIHREGYEANMEVQEAWDIGQAEFASGRHGDFDWSAYWSDDPRGRSAAAFARIVRLNRRTLADLHEPLTEAGATLLREAYDRKAYPEVFRDDRDATPDLEAALALEDLRPGQRAEIEQMAVEFRAACDELRRGLVAHRTAVPLDVRRQSEAWWKHQEDRRRADARVEAERANLNDGVRVRLRSCLTEDQATRIGL